MNVSVVYSYIFRGMIFVTAYFLSRDKFICYCVYVRKPFLWQDTRYKNGTGEYGVTNDAFY